MTERIIHSCIICGDTFKHRKDKANKYCGQPCYRKEQRSGRYQHVADKRRTVPERPCSHCGKLIIKTLGKRRNGKPAENIFCDRDCYDAFRAAIIVSRRKHCERCKAEFDPFTSETKYCSDKCRRLQEKSEPKHCVNCNTWFTPMAVVRGVLTCKNDSKTCSRECHIGWIRNNEERKRKISKAFTGSNHPNWKGGMAHQNLGYRGPNWAKQREAARKRDGYKCLDCGMTNDESLKKYNEQLSADHVVPFHNFTDYRKANVLSNLETRCKACHRTAEAARTMNQMVLPLNPKRHHQHKKRGLKGSDHPLALLTEADVMMIRNERKKVGGKTNAQLASELGVARGVVRAAARGKTWKHVPM